MTTPNKTITTFLRTRAWIIVLIFFLAIPRAQGEEIPRKDDLTLAEKGVITLILCGLFCYGYDQERQRVEGDNLITDIRVDGEPRDTQNGVNATPYIIGASIPIGWFLSEMISEIRGQKTEVRNQEAENRKRKGKNGVEGPAKDKIIEAGACAGGEKKVEGVVNYALNRKSGLEGRCRASGEKMC